MAKFLCLCGHVISTSGEIPNRDQWHLLSDVEFGEFVGLVDAEEIYRLTRIAFRCPVSDHLWVFWGGFDGPPTVYEPVEIAWEGDS